MNLKQYLLILSLIITTPFSSLAALTPTTPPVKSNAQQSNKIIRLADYKEKEYLALNEIAELERIPTSNLEKYYTKQYNKGYYKNKPAQVYEDLSNDVFLAIVFQRIYIKILANYKTIERRTTSSISYFPTKNGITPIFNTHPDGYYVKGALPLQPPIITGEDIDNIKATTPRKLIISRYTQAATLIGKEKYFKNPEYYKTGRYELLQEIEHFSKDIKINP